MAPALPTPSTSHLSFSTIYEPSEDSFLLLDTLSSPSQQAFFRSRFPDSSPTPLILEVGTGSGIVIAFLTANARTIFGRSVLSLGVDVNIDACLGTATTVEQAVKTASEHAAKLIPAATATTTVTTTPPQTQARTGTYLASITSDLTTAIKPASIDVLVFNPPYVPTEELPNLPTAPSSSAAAVLASPSPGTTSLTDQQRRAAAAQARHDRESHLLALSYAGGMDGMETTNRLLEQIPDVLSRRGVAYILLCARNGVEEVRSRVLQWQHWPDGDDSQDQYSWRAEIVGESGGKGGWERLSILRIWRDFAGPEDG